MDRLMSSYPAGLKEAFGIERLDSLEHYIDAEMLSLIVPLALAFFAIRCVAGPTVGAEERGHLDALLALPLARRVVVAASIMVCAIDLVAILAVIWAMTVAAALVAGSDVSLGTLAAGIGSVWPLAMLFAGLTALIAGLARGSATVTALAVSTVVAMYALDLVGRLAGAIEPLRVLSAFRYYGSAIDDGLDVIHILVLCVAGLVLATLGAALFDRRDIR
jgi:ABC-2 type transport system permease protein